MDARRLMTGDVAWIPPTASIAEAARRLGAAPPGVTGLLVGTDERAEPLGILTAVDILRAALRTALEPGRLDCECARERPVHPEDLARDSFLDAMACAAKGLPVRAVMSSPVRCVSEDASAAQVMDALVRGRIEAVPVLRDGRAIGMV